MMYILKISSIESFCEFAADYYISLLKPVMRLIIIVVYSLGSKFIFATSTRVVKHMTALAGKAKFISGKCTIIWRVPIIYQSLEVDTPNETDKKTFRTMAVVSAPSKT